MLKSTIPEYPNPIDSRCLQFELSYYMLGKEQIDNLMISFYTWCQSFMNNQCVAEWFWGRRKITSSSIPFRISQNTAYTFGMDANVVSNVVYDRKTYKENKQKLLADASTTRKELDCSKDYYTFFESQFFDIPESPSAWKETLLRFFNEKGRFCLSSVTSTDIHAFASACPYHSKPYLFYGSIRFYVFLYCVSGNISNVVTNMVAFLKEASVSFVNINACVSLSPIVSPSPCSPHMTYFGGNVFQDGTHISEGVMATEWYKSYYLQGAEWYNIISPLVQQHIPNLSRDISRYINLACETLDTGGIAVWVKQNIDLIDITDLTPMKQLLYPALYPGMMKVGKQFILSRRDSGLISKPRKRWELIPIFEDEIIVTDATVIFQHHYKPSKEHGIL